MTLSTQLGTQGTALGGDAGGFFDDGGADVATGGDANGNANAKPETTSADPSAGSPVLAGADDALNTNLAPNPALTFGAAEFVASGGVISAFPIAAGAPGYALTAPDAQSPSYMQAAAYGQANDLSVPDVERLSTIVDNRGNVFDSDVPLNSVPRENVQRYVDAINPNANGAFDARPAFREWQNDEMKRPSVQAVMKMGSNESGGEITDDDVTGGTSSDDANGGIGDGGSGDADGGIGDGGSGPTGGGNDDGTGSPNDPPTFVNDSSMWNPCDLVGQATPGVDANGNPVSRMDTIRVTSSPSPAGGDMSITVTAPASHGGSPNDYLNVDGYAIGATSSGRTNTATESLPPIENLYTPVEGFFASGFRTAVAGMANPNASWDERIINGALATAVSPLALLDMMGEGLLNAPNQAARSGQLFARGTVTSDTDTRVISTLAGIVDLTSAFNGAAGPFAGIGAPTRVMTAEEYALRNLQSAESYAAARATYLGLQSNTAAQTIANIENRFANATREVGFVVDRQSGQILGVTRSGLDNGTQMRLNPQTDFAMMRGNIFTHNHPLGGAFSMEDVAAAIGSGAGEFRAFTPTRTMSLTFDNPHAHLFGKPDAAIVFMENEQTAIIASYRARVADGSLLPPAELAARLAYQSEYFMELLVERNPWIHYTSSPR